MKFAPLTLLTAALLLAGCSHPQPVYYPPPPPSVSAVYQQGFHDGYDAARRDVAEGRPPNFEHHPRFRNPPVPPPAVEEYRHAFREGYERFLHQGPPPPTPGY
jgi:hypothetical protein